MPFQGKKDAFQRNFVNKHSKHCAMLTELKKPGCNAFHSYDAGIVITMLSVQSSLKRFITEISENKDLLLLLLYHADHNSKAIVL